MEHDLHLGPLCDLQAKLTCAQGVQGLDLFVVYVAFNSQGHIATGSLQVEETSTYCTVNHRASARNYQLSNMKHPAQDSNRRPQRLEARTVTATPPSPLGSARGVMGWLYVQLLYYQDKTPLTISI